MILMSLSWDEVLKEHSRSVTQQVIHSSVFDVSRRLSEQRSDTYRACLLLLRQY